MCISRFKTYHDMTKKKKIYIYINLHEYTMGIATIIGNKPTNSEHLIGSHLKLILFSIEHSFSTKTQLIINKNVKEDQNMK